MKSVTWYFMHDTSTKWNESLCLGRPTTILWTLNTPVHAIYAAKRVMCCQILRTGALFKYHFAYVAEIRRFAMKWERFRYWRPLVSVDTVWSFDVIFLVGLIRLLNKQSIFWWFKTSLLWSYVVTVLSFYIHYVKGMGGGGGSFNTKFSFVVCFVLVWFWFSIQFHWASIPRYPLRFGIIRPVIGRTIKHSLKRYFDEIFVTV